MRIRAMKKQSQNKPNFLAKSAFSGYKFVLCRAYCVVRLGDIGFFAGLRMIKRGKEVSYGDGREKS